jgi:beta-lactamase family protein
MARVAATVLLMAATVAPGLALAGPGTAERSQAALRELTSTAGIRAAQDFARSRRGLVAFAVLDQRNRLRGLGRTQRFPSASVVKAMMMVSILRRAEGRRLTDIERSLLVPMVTRSDNDTASAIYGRIGDRGLNAVARAAGMRKFKPSSVWGNSQITAADQVRFFIQIDELVPPAHRRYARKLLSSIVKPQRWGVPPIARSKGLKTFFKGGWRTCCVHQVALLERGRSRVALAVLTKGAPSKEYSHETIARIAKRVLRREAR